MARAMTYNVDYCLMLYDAHLMCPRALNAHYSMIRLYYAKAQFKCDKCGHCWTSMSARYEISRVMKNLGFTIFEHFFPNSFQSTYWDLTHNGIKPVKRLLQRKGYMHGRHNPLLCEACYLGFCY